MKKLMCAVAALAAGVAMADVTSANIVGYQTIEIPGGRVYSMFCPVFDKVGGATFKLGDIEVVGQDGKEYDGSDNAHKLTGLTARKLKNGALAMGTTWNYATTLKNGVPYKWTLQNAHTNEFESGEGIIVCNNSSNVFFRVSGEVVLEPMYCIPGGRVYSIWGNNTPNDITLGDIGVYGLDGKEYDGSDNAHKLTGLTARKLKNGALAMGTTWNYATTLKNGVPYKWTLQNAHTNVIAAGESIIVCNNSTNVFFRLPSPIK